MRIMCTSDLHANREGPEKMRKITAKIFEALAKNRVDVYLEAGDLDSEVFAQQFFGKLEELGEKTGLQTFVTPGNMDWSLPADGKHVSVLNGQIAEVGGYYFFGAGHVPTNFFRIAMKMTEGINPRKLILLSHIPPFGVMDCMWNGQLMGFDGFTRFLEEKKPLMHVFGHIHESRGVEMFRETLAVNCSVMGNYKAYIIDLPKMNISEVALK